MAKFSGFTSTFRNLPLWVPGFLLVLSMTLMAWSYLRIHENQVAQDHFTQQATEQFDRIRRSLRLAQNSLNAVGAYFDGTPNLDRQTFKRLTRPILAQDRTLRALEWVPKVPSDQRMQWVAQAREDGFPDFDFTERGPRGHMVSAASRPLHFPVYYLEPYGGNEVAMGFDLASNKARRQTLKLASNTGMMTASGRIRLVQEAQKGSYGFLIFRPVYDTGAQRHNEKTLKGFVLGVFSIDHIVQDALDSTRENVTLVDDDASPGEALLYPGNNPAPNADETSQLPHFVRQVDMANRSWTVNIRPTAADYVPTRFESDTVLVLGLLISLLWGAYLRQKGQQHRAIERTVTDRTRALAQEREFNDAVFNTIGNIVLVLDRSGSIVRFNHAAEQITGFRFDDVKAQPFVWERFLLPEQRPNVRKIFERFHQDELPTRYENHWVNKSGDAHLFDWTNTVIRDDEGQPEYLITVGVDITERKQAEDTVRASEQRFRQLFEHNNAPMMLIDPADGQIINVNRAAAAFYGWSEAHMRGMKIDEINALSPEEVTEEMTRAQDEQRNYFVFTHRRANGQPRIVEVHTTPIEVAGRNMLISIIHDISQRIRAERHVQQLLREQTVMLDNGIVGIVKARDRNIIWANRAFEQMLGYDHGGLNGRPTQDIYQRDEDYKTIGRQAYALLETGENFHGHLQMQRKDGGNIWVDISGSMLNPEQGESLWVFIDITDQKQAEEEILQLAYFDPLTHLPNRRLLLDRLNRALSSSQRRQEHGALMILDMDHFKTLNDTQGHDAGDQLLVEIARRLTNCVRQEDTVGRLGGDEFVVLLEFLGPDAHTAAVRARSVAQKIRAVLSMPYEIGPEDIPFHTTASLGVSLFLGQEESAKTLMKHADVALYQAKGAGRDAVYFFDPEMQAGIDARVIMENALRQALSNNELHLHYQPQCDHEGHLIGAEALLRWISAELGTIPPTMFIPLAEETGLIQPIGQWVLDSACKQLARWAEEPDTRDLVMSVNVSARQFLQADFPDQVKACLDSSGADPHRLNLELTESTVLNNLDQAIVQMRELNTLGVKFALDDFGTGYSSLSYLKRLPLSQVKIDRSFVQDLTADGNDEAIVRAILAMGQSLGLDVLAEGVETEAQREFLLRHGCRAYQGFLFGRPEPVEALRNRNNQLTRRGSGPAEDHSSSGSMMSTTCPADTGLP